MSDPVTQAQFFEGLQQIHTKIDTKHASIHRLIDDRADRIEDKLTLHAEQDDAVEHRVHAIEIERRVNADQRRQTERDRDRRASLLGALAGVGVAGVVKLAELFFR